MSDPSKGLTAEDIEKFLDKAKKQIEESANKPDTFWIMKGHLKALIKGGFRIRQGIQNIADDESIPDNALLEILK